MAKPLLDIKCITEESCKYPVAVRIAMDDGTVQTYDLKYDMHPNFADAMSSLDKMFNCVRVTGYQYVSRDQRKRKNRIRRGKR